MHASTVVKHPASTQVQPLPWLPSTCFLPLQSDPGPEMSVWAMSIPVASWAFVSILCLQDPCWSCVASTYHSLGVLRVRTSLKAEVRPPLGPGDPGEAKGCSSSSDVKPCPKWMAKSSRPVLTDATLAHTPRQVLVRFGEHPLQWQTSANYTTGEKGKILREGPPPPQVCSVGST